MRPYTHIHSEQLLRRPDKFVWHVIWSCPGHWGVEAILQRNVHCYRIEFSMKIEITQWLDAEAHSHFHKVDNETWRPSSNDKMKTQKVISARQRFGSMKQIMEEKNNRKMIKFPAKYAQARIDCDSSIVTRRRKFNVIPHMTNSFMNSRKKHVCFLLTARFSVRTGHLVFAIMLAIRVCLILCANKYLYYNSSLHVRRKCGHSIGWHSAQARTASINNKSAWRRRPAPARADSKHPKCTAKFYL